MQVIKAKWLPKDKPEFEPEGQHILELTEATANLDYILSSVRDHWGDGYVLVTNDGIQLENSSSFGECSW